MRISVSRRSSVHGQATFQDGTRDLEPCIVHVITPCADCCNLELQRHEEHSTTHARNKHPLVQAVSLYTELKLEVGGLLPFLMVTSRDVQVFWDLSRWISLTSNTVSRDQTTKRQLHESQCGCSSRVALATVSRSRGSSLTSWTSARAVLNSMFHHSPLRFTFVHLAGKIRAKWVPLELQ